MTATATGQMNLLDLLAELNQRPRFYLGTHQPGWLWRNDVNVPLFVAYPRLREYKKLRRARVLWALDSGGYSELAQHGRWTVTAAEYVRDVARFTREIGCLEWAAPQDWMCEPWIVHGGNGCPGTGKTIAEHQMLTVWNYIRLLELWPEHSNDPCPFIPVLQGWTLSDYLWCADMYRAAGINLAKQRAVGLGSVCRRQNTIRIGIIAMFLAGAGIPLHGFGVKTTGVASYGKYLTSADSLAWSFDARRSEPMPGHAHKNCANCLPYALAWRDRVINHANRAMQDPTSTGLEFAA